ncbi:MAG: hypothetical protein AAFY51_05355 [Pseudomonadota bacterium]
MPSKKPLLPLEPVPDLPDVFRARRGASAMAAIRLRDGRLALYSPVKDLSHEAVERISSMGGAAVLIAPSHFHHLGQREYLEAFPGASIYAPLAAHPRLKKQTGLDFLDVMELVRALPEAVRFHVPPGLKAEELWLEVSSGDNVGLQVCDAFGAPAKEDGLPVEHAAVRGAFRTMCLKDAAVFREWAQDYFGTIELTHLLPCHGARVSGPGLSAHLSQTLESL